tara:strand:- start:472 stop:741 length:270 start_codon:yes stop_codon:yes gene_type:complete
MKKFKVEYERILKELPTTPEVSEDLNEEGDELLADSKPRLEYLIINAEDKEQAFDKAEDELYALRDSDMFHLNVLDSIEIKEGDILWTK